MLAEPGIQARLHDLHATFLEPSAGEGAFLREILHQKLNYVDQISNKTNWGDNALWALMSIYGIELLPDNLIVARRSMQEIFINHYQFFMQRQLSSKTALAKSAEFIIRTNVVQGNTLTYRNDQDQLIELSHWNPIAGKVQRDPFTFKSLFNNGDANDVNASAGQLSLFADFAEEPPQYEATPVTKVYQQE